MYKEKNFIGNDKREQLIEEGYSLVFYFNGCICYESKNERREFQIIIDGKKRNSIYFVFTKGRNFHKTQDLKNFSKEIKSIKIECVMDYNDEIDIQNKSYYFYHNIPDNLFKSMKTSFYDVFSELLIFKESEIKKYMDLEDYF